MLNELISNYSKFFTEIHILWYISGILAYSYFMCLIVHLVRNSKVLRVGNFINIYNIFYEAKKF